LPCFPFHFMLKSRSLLQGKGFGFFSDKFGSMELRSNDAIIDSLSTQPPKPYIVRLFMIRSILDGAIDENESANIKSLKDTGFQGMFIG
ncbi:MAG: hypothetical protein RR797_06905, partial [Christensenella sp.]